MSKGLALVIEDDENLVGLFAEAVRRAGFEVETYLRGDTALDRLRVCTPRVVVLDLHLPKISGLALLRYIQADERFKLTRIIIATADNVSGDPLREQVDLVLVKPVSFAQLRDLASRL